MASLIFPRLGSHLLADEFGLSVDFLATAGQVNDCTQAAELLGEQKAVWVLADRGYDSETILDHIEAMGAVAVVPSKSNCKRQRSHDKELYLQPNRIERCFSRLKHFRRFATRYEKLKTNFKALVAHACSWLQSIGHEYLVSGAKRMEHGVLCSNIPHATKGHVSRRAVRCVGTARCHTISIAV